MLNLLGVVDTQKLLFLTPPWEGWGYLLWVEFLNWRKRQFLCGTEAPMHEAYQEQLQNPIKKMEKSHFPGSSPSTEEQHTFPKT